MRSLFIDLEGLSEEDILDIEIVFCQGLMAGTSSNSFSPNVELSEESLSIVLNRLLEGYSRQNIFLKANSGFKFEDRNSVLLENELDRVLVYNDIIDLLSLFSEVPISITADDLSRSVTIKEFLNFYNKFALRCHGLYTRK